MVIIAAFLYGANPSFILYEIFGFRVRDLELKNIFRAIMGLYIAFGLYWFYAIFYQQHLRSALISNMLFMGGLAIGRTVSLIADGVSYQFTIGMLLEYLMLFWGWYNYKGYIKQKL